MSDPATALRLAIVGQEIGAHQETQDAQDRIISSLLLGAATLFGARVQLSWPDGLPHGFTETTLREFGQSMRDRLESEEKRAEHDRILGTCAAYITSNTDPFALADRVSNVLKEHGLDGLDA